MSLETLKKLSYQTQVSSKQVDKEQSKTKIHTWTEQNKL